MRLGVTSGDPAGVGPEVSLRALQCRELCDNCRLLVFGDADLLRDRAVGMGLATDFEVLSIEALSGSSTLPERCIVHVPAPRADIAPGRGSTACGEAAAQNIVACAHACLDGNLDAMVTAPINKKFFNEAGYAFPGHTEFLAHLAGVSAFAMAFLTEHLKVVLVTIHLPLREAIERITSASVGEKLDVMLTEFPRLGLPCRRIAVAGLNPHAGESGILGHEEIERIAPALAEARRRYSDVLIEGPVPADTLFYRAVRGEFDAVLALYHDQGLAPIKLVGFGEAVNVTLGLPFVRTSVDHGTAYEIAGRGCARPDSMFSAIRWALRLCRSRRA